MAVPLFNSNGRSTAGSTVEWQRSIPLGQFRRFRRPIFGGSARQEFTKRTQGLLPSREITKRTQSLPRSREITKRTQGPRDSRLLRERFDIQPMFAPAWATEGMRSSDVMDNIGEMPRHGA